MSRKSFKLLDSRRLKTMVISSASQERFQVSRFVEPTKKMSLLPTTIRTAPNHQLLPNIHHHSNRTSTPNHQLLPNNHYIAFTNWFQNNCLSFFFLSQLLNLSFLLQCTCSEVLNQATRFLELLITLSLPLCQRFGFVFLVDCLYFFFIMFCFSLTSFYIVC